MKKIQKISCANMAAFVMNFSIRWLDSDGAWHTSHWNSGNYPVGQHVVSPDLVSIGVPADALAITPYVHAVLGGNETGSPSIQYEKNDQVATYDVRGTTLNFSVELVA